MLVLTRRTDQKVSFPNVGITVEVLKVKGNVVKLGIDAPEHVRILRHEVQETRSSMQETIESSLLPEPPDSRRAELHALRNEVNTAKLATHLLSEQLKVGATAEAAESLEILTQQFERLEEQLGVLKKTAQEALSSPVEISRPGRVLVVEDDTNELRLMAGIIQMAGLDVISASNGERALDVIRGGWTPDAIVVDMGLPGMCGIELVQTLRQDDEFRGVSAYAVSGSGPDEFDLDPASIGIREWYTKPVDPELLVRRVTRDIQSDATANQAS